MRGTIFLANRASGRHLDIYQTLKNYPSGLFCTEFQFQACNWICSPQYKSHGSAYMAIVFYFIEL